MKKPIIIVLAVILIIPIIVLMIINSINNNKFWEASATTCFSLIFAVALSFYLVQRQNDYRNQKSIFAKLVESLINIIEDTKSYDFSSSTKEEILMKKRSINNKLMLIRSYSKQFSIQKEVEFLDNKFSEYTELIGNHIEDMETLKKMKDDFYRPLSLMSQKLYEIMIKLYN